MTEAAVTEAAVIDRAPAESETIRRAEPSDLDAILTLERGGFDPASRWSTESWAAELIGADRHVLVADRRLSSSKPGLSEPGFPRGSRRAGAADSLVSGPAGAADSLVSRPATAVDAQGPRQERPADTGLLGVATLQLVGDTADLHRVVVAPNHRGRGIGRALVTAGLAWASGRHASRMLLEVEHDNAPALALYRGLGFAELARRKDYYGAGRHALVMRCDIARRDDVPVRDDSAARDDLPAKDDSAARDDSAGLGS